MSSVALVGLVKEKAPRVIGIDGPSGPSHGLALDPAMRKRLGLKPGTSFSDYKLSEILLRKRGIGVYGTPRDLDRADPFFHWMQEAVALFEALADRGYPRLGQGGVPPGAAEVFPQGTFRVLSGERLSKKDRAEGMRQRLDLLAGLGPDACLSGLTKKETIDGLDALAAAYTALLIDRGKVEWLGDEKEGQLALPLMRGV